MANITCNIELNYIDNGYLTTITGIVNGIITREIIESEILTAIAINNSLAWALDDNTVIALKN